MTLAYKFHRGLQIALSINLTSIVASVCLVILIVFAHYSDAAEKDPSIQQLQKHVSLLEKEKRLGGDAAHALITIGKDSIPYLLQLLTSEDKGIRAKAAWALANMSSESLSDPYLLQNILPFLDDDHLIVRGNIIGAIETIVKDNPKIKLDDKTIQKLITSLKDTDTVIGEVFVHIGRPAIPHLIQALNNPDELIRGKAAWTLAKIGPNANEALPMLIRHLKGDTKYVRWGCLAAIDELKIDAEHLVPLLIEILKRDKDHDIRVNALYMLSDLGSEAKDAIPILKEIQASKDGSLASRSQGRIAGMVLESITAAD